MQGVCVEEKRQYIYIVIKNIDEFSVLWVFKCTVIFDVGFVSMETINQKVNLCRCACFVYCIVFTI